MTTVNQLPPVAKSRKKSKQHSSAQRTEILELCQQPDASIVEIAKQFDIHVNTIYKWRHKAKQKVQSAVAQTQTAFIPIPFASTTSQQLNKSIRIEVPSSQHQQSIVIEWPLESSTELSMFIQGLTL